MDSKAMETELIGLEKKYWQAMQDKDVKAATSMTDFPCIVAGSSGAMSVDEPSFGKMLEGASWDIKDFTLENGAQVRMLTDDVALIAYKITEDLTVDGKPVTLKAADASVWVRRNGEWRCALHTESVAGDPYGRDKAKH